MASKFVGDQDEAEAILRMLRLANGKDPDGDDDATRNQATTGDGEDQEADADRSSE